MPSRRNCLTFWDIIWYNALRLAGSITTVTLISDKVRIGCRRARHLFYYPAVFRKRITLRASLTFYRNIKMPKRPNKPQVKTILARHYRILGKSFLPILALIFFLNPILVLANSEFTGNIVIRQQTKTASGISVCGPVTVDLDILDIICRANIKSLEDYERWLQKTVKYKGDDGADVWSLPEETLTKKYGDCEDLAFLNKAFLHVLGYQPKVMALVRFGDKKGHAICVFEENGYYLWFDNTSLNKISAASIEEFSDYVLMNGLYTMLFEINVGDEKQNILSAGIIE